MNQLMLILIGAAAALIIVVFFANDKKTEEAVKKQTDEVVARFNSATQKVEALAGSVKIWGETTEKNKQYSVYLKSQVDNALKLFEKVNQHHELLKKEFEILREKQLQLQEILSNKRPIIRLERKRRVLGRGVKSLIDDAKKQVKDK